MKKWISGQKILEQHGIEGLELFEYVKKGLQPYNQKGELKPRPDISEMLSELKKQKEKLAILERCIKEPLDPNDEKQKILNARRKVAGIDDEKDLQDTKKRIKTIEGELPHPNLYYWKDYSLPDPEEKALEIIIDLVNSNFKFDEVDEVIGKNVKKPLPDHLTDKKLRPDQRHRFECRKTAEKLWKKDPEITIADMIHKDEINVLLNGNPAKAGEELDTICVGLTPRGFKRMAGRSRVNREVHARF